MFLVIYIKGIFRAYLVQANTTDSHRPLTTTGNGNP
jgi:hypothetical protein